MAKRALAGVLWEAANVHLLSGGAADSRQTSTKELVSCYSIARALGFEPTFEPLPDDVSDFLESLGCNTGSGYPIGYACTPEAQSWRYMWLLLAMHVAEDEGLMVEVPDA